MPDRQDLLTPEDAAVRAGVSARTVVYWIEYGQMEAVETQHGWRIRPGDLEFFLEGRAIEDAIVRAHKAHGDRGWVLGNCPECERMMPIPTVPHANWVCSEACREQRPNCEVVPDY